ncbi:MAG: hypothetical protein ABIC40_01800 [bacterium]
MTEIGRRTAIITATAAFAIHIVVGAIGGGDIVDVVVKGLLAGIIFGLCGLLVGNLFQTYVFNAANREITIRALERELRAKMRQQEREKRNKVDETESEAEV